MTLVLDTISEMFSRIIDLVYGPRPVPTRSFVGGVTVPEERWETLPNDTTASYTYKITFEPNLPVQVYFYPPNGALFLYDTGEQKLMNEFEELPDVPLSKSRARKLGLVYIGEL